MDLYDVRPMWQKPSFDEILECLHRLRMEPPVWDAKAMASDILLREETSEQLRRRTAPYLASIVKSNLHWIDDEQDRETIWAEAGKRISERCGRTGNYSYRVILYC
jgi:hypothetical protein